MIVNRDTRSLEEKFAQGRMMEPFRVGKPKMRPMVEGGEISGYTCGVPESRRYFGKTMKEAYARWYYFEVTSKIVTM